MNRRHFLRSASVAAMAMSPVARLAAEEKFDLPIVDAHVHFWDPAKLEYAWLKNSPIGQPKLPADYFRATSGFNVEKLVFVQADCSPAQAEQEAAWVQTLAREEKRIGAIIAYAPIDDAATAEAALRHLAALPQVRGIRRLVQGEADSHICARPEFIAGVKKLAAHKFHFEIGARPDQLADAAKLVEQCPEIQFTLDHLGNPDIVHYAMQPWASDIKRLAQFPNIACKISGAVTKADWKSWKPAQLRPFIDQVLDTFGPNRVMFGSDWPVCLLASEWRRWAETLFEMTAHRSLEDRRKLFSENAKAFYRLN